MKKYSKLSYEQWVTVTLMNGRTEWWLLLALDTTYVCMHTYAHVYVYNIHIYVYIHKHTHTFSEKQGSTEGLKAILYTPLLADFTRDKRTCVCLTVCRGEYEKKGKYEP